MTNQKPTVCVLARESPAHYKELDYEIIGRNFPCTVHQYNYDPQNILRFIALMRETDVLVSWFANPWLAVIWPLIRKKPKLAIIAGGYDVADCPELNYGHQHRPILKQLGHSILSSADDILTISDFSREELLRFAKPKATQTIYCAVDFCEFSVLKTTPRKNQVITIGAMENFISRRKGHFRFVEVAKKMPNTHFLLAGKPVDDTIDRLKAMAPPNLEIRGFLSREELLQELLASKVYLQLSHHEGFGLSAIEAVACGCYPVVANNTALTEVTLNQGYTVDGGDIDGAVNAIQVALDQDLHMEIESGSIAEHFSVERREEGLVRAIQSLADA
ncbi:MAG: glycosyltransferase family 4 protein [Verrucomicrobiota bacterium]